MDLRAHATKEYFEKDQWGKKSLTVYPHTPVTTNSSTRLRKNRTTANIPQTIGKESREVEGEHSGSDTNGHKPSPERQRPISTQQGGDRAKEQVKKAIEVLENGKNPHKDLVWNSKPPMLNEIKDIIKKFKRKKAKGPDGITTDLVKEFDDDSLEEVRKLTRSWRYQTL